MSFTYTTGVPNPPNSPSTDVVNMQTNTNTIGNWVSVDHVGFNNSLAGTHNQSTYNSLLSDPTTSITQGAAYTKTVGSDIELFYRHKSNGSVIQLTSSILPVANTPGYSFLPGGILIQWGIATLLNASATPVTFTPNFKVATTPYTIQLTFGNSTPAGVTISVSSSSVSNSGFNIICSPTPSGGQLVYWIAIGTA